MSNEKRDIQRKLECFNMPGRSAMPAKRTCILGFAGLASTDGEMREEALGDKLQ